MVEKTKKRKKSSISEEDISLVLQRYAPATVLALLQEVAQVQDAEIDWHALVKKTTTGITNAREYQMIWRHLAYHEPLVEKLDNAAQPLDDDSDLECELEAFPRVSSEASTEAAACVKVLIASGLPSDSSLPNGSTVEAPLTINIPSGLKNSQIANSMQGRNITVPVSVQKQSLPVGTSAEGLDGNGAASGNLAPKRKRKPWSPAEDSELRAAVQKNGEGNWANILKGGDFNSDRTASQLSQRWAIIKKRGGNLIIGGGSQITEAQLATNRAVSLALGGQSSTLKTNNSAQIAAEAVSVGAQPLNQSQQDSFATSASPPGTSGSSSKSRVPSRKPTPKSALGPDPIAATAMAAGARIGSPSDAASLVKAAQSKNAVHIMPSAGSLMKSSVPNVHYVHPGLAVSKLTTYSVAPSDPLRSVGIQQVHGHPLKSAAPAFQPSSTFCNPGSKASSEPNGITTNGPPVRTGIDDVNTTITDASKELNQNHVADVVNIPREQVENNAAFSGLVSERQWQEDQAYISVRNMKDHGQEDQISVLGNDRIEQVRVVQSTSPSLKAIVSSTCQGAETAGSDQMVVMGNPAEQLSASKFHKTNGSSLLNLSVEGGVDYLSVVEDHRVNGRQDDPQGMAVNGSEQKMEFICKAGSGSEMEREEKIVVGLE